MEYNHALQRINERDILNYNDTDLEEILSVTQRNGEFIANSTKGRTVYRVQYLGKTLYPVLNKEEDYIVTFLSEHMVNRNLRSKQFKHLGMFGKTGRRKK